MPRKKNYVLDSRRLAQVMDTSEAPNTTESEPESSCEKDSATIDIVALLGPEARFVGSERNINLTAGLNRGIDIWVAATIKIFKALLRSGTREISTVCNYGRQIMHFFDFLTNDREVPRVSAPENLSPLHIEAYVGWLQQRASDLKWGEETTRNAYKVTKTVLSEMFDEGLIAGDKSKFFRRGVFKTGRASRTGLSDAEQGRLAMAIKRDLSAVHHGRLQLTAPEVQALRLLVIGHRQGKSTTPMLELDRAALRPGAMPGTVAIRTVKFRGKTVRDSPGRAAPDAKDADAVPDYEEMVFNLSEGAVLEQAIKSTEALVSDAPTQYKNRIWLYRAYGVGVHAKDAGKVTCLTAVTLRNAIVSLTDRHGLLADDGQPLTVSLSRLRKSFFDRSFRINDGNIPKVAAQMGNTPKVADVSYDSMNDARKAEAANFMNGGYVDLMRQPPRVVKIEPFKAPADGAPSELPEKTPVSGCTDTLYGEHAPRDGSNHCDRFVMCLFCHSFAIVGTVDELWRLFSFQVFAKSELKYLDDVFAQDPTDDDTALDNLRQRYKVAIPYIDEFTQRQFPPKTISEARAKTKSALHPFWDYQMKSSRAARSLLNGYEATIDVGVPIDVRSTGGVHGQ